MTPTTRSRATIKRLLLISLASLLMSACATTTEYARQAYEYGKHAGSWVGQKIESLYSSEGKPSAEKPQVDGGKVVEYQHQQTVTDATVTPPAPAPTTSPTGLASQAAPTTSVEATPTRVVPCTTRYKVDRSGTIRSWTIDGEGCKAIQNDPVRHP